MTALPSIFDTRFFDQFAVGYSPLVEELQRVAKSMSTNYPPYNIRQVDKNKYVIELAVAGFGKSDIEIEMKGNKLVVSGRVADDTNNSKNYLYRGIAERAFSRVWNIADSVTVNDAELTNGMLRIALENMVKVNDAVKKIAIRPTETK
jgi:molecular chaperone IbpA